MNRRKKCGPKPFLKNVIIHHRTTLSRHSLPYFVNSFCTPAMNERHPGKFEKKACRHLDWIGPDGGWTSVVGLVFPPRWFTYTVMVQSQWPRVWERKTQTVQLVESDAIHPAYLETLEVTHHQWLRTPRNLRWKRNVQKTLGLSGEGPRASTCLVV